MSHVSRLGALVAASALVVTGLTLGASSAQAAADTRPQSQAATWLAGQLTEGLMYNPAFGGFNDYGLSIDTALALEAVGGYDSDVSAIGNAIRDRYYSYTTGADFGGPEVYAGGQAKALVMAQVAGTAPALYATAVQRQLENNVATDGDLAGRIENAGETDFLSGDPSDSANVFGQAFAARALANAPASDLKEQVVSFLLAQQCADGGFREKFDAKDDPSQGCDVADAATYGDRVGATATAVLNLAAIPADGSVSTAISSARAWLKTQQNPDGSFGSNGGNANSTGLAAQAIGASDEGSAAAGWLRERQADDTDACTKLAEDIGAVGFISDSLAAGRSDGIVTNTVGEWQRATSQSVVALQYLGAAATPTLALTGPTGYVRGASEATYDVDGAVSGSALCATVGNSTSAGVADGAGAAQIALSLPGGTANRTVTLTDRDGNTATVATQVLGATKLSVKPRNFRVKKKRVLKVVVSGLAAGEKVTVRLRGNQVAGTANNSGRFVAKMRPGSRLGKARILATGEFADIRRGKAFVKVVR